LFANAGLYYLRSGKAGTASKAREQFGKALSTAGAARGEARDALLLDLARMQLDLGGGAEEVDSDRRLPWKDAQRSLAATLRVIRSREARLHGLRLVVAGVIE